MTNKFCGEFRKEIERCSRLYEGFSEAAPFVESIFEAIEKYFETNPLPSLPAADGEETTARIREGCSILMDPGVPGAAFLDLLKICGQKMVKANKNYKGVERQLKAAADDFFSDEGDTLSREEIDRFHEKLVKDKVLEQDMATFLFSILLSAFYRQQLASQSEVLRTDLWEGGDCPLCGEKPHFGLLRPADGAKELHCWLCATRWVHTRIKCPFCDNSDQEQLGYFTLNDRETCRVNICRHCNLYFKLFDARKFSVEGEEVNPFIHNLASLTYDLLARQEGFAPGSGLEWINRDELSERKD